MAKQIHILDQDFGEPGTRFVKCVFWYPIVAVNRRVPKPAFKSSAPPENISVQDQADLEAGALLEDVLIVSFPTSYNVAQMKTEVTTRYTDKASAIAAGPAIRQFYAVFFDSVTGWSA